MYLISKRQVKQLIRDTIEAEVSSDCVEFIQSYFTELITMCIKKGCQVYISENQLNKDIGIPEIKRIPESIYKRLFFKLFKEILDKLNEGKTAQYSRDTVLSKVGYGGI